MSDVIKMKMNEKGNIGKTIAIVVIILAVLVVLFSSFTTVRAGHTGVVTTFGKVSDTVLTEGLHFKVPFIQNIVIMDNRVLKTQTDGISASKDLQNVTSSIVLNYRVDKTDSANLYKNVGINFESTIVTPAIHECIKGVTAKFTAEELITERSSVSVQMKDSLQDKLEPYGLNIEILNIVDFSFSEEFNNAIEAKQTAQQNALKAQQDLARVKVEAEQEVVKARADAEAYKLKNQELSDKTLLMEYINKWDGKLPIVSSDGQILMDVNKMIENAKTPNN